MPVLLEVLDAAGLPVAEAAGYEADDVIGTLAVAAAADGIDVTISTSDKDFAQLVRPGIALVNTMSGSRIDSDQAVVDKYGVRADQIVDLLALMGDTIDNVPGVDKCGPKTAAKWLAEYGSLDGVIAKPLAEPYAEDKRVMWKIKHERTADCVVAGYREHKSGPDAVGSLLLGLYDAVFAILSWAAFEYVVTE